MSKNLPIFRRMIAVAHTARNCGRLAMTIEGEDEGSRTSIDNLKPITQDTPHTTIEGYCVRDAKIRTLMGWEYSHWMLIESAFICALVEEVSLVLDDFAEPYSDILSMVRSEIFVINGKGTGFHKRKPEPRQYPQEAGPQTARALTTDERVALLDKQFLEIWDEFRWLIPDGEYRVTPQFKVGSLEEHSAGTIANSLEQVMSIARENIVLEKLNVDDLPILMPPSVTKAQTDARKREVILDWLRENSDTLAEVMSLEPIEPAPSLEHRASHKAPVKSGSDLFRHE